MAGAGVTQRLDAKAGVLAGVIGGLVFLILELMMVPLFLGDPMWAPPRMIAAIAMGEGVLPPPGTFDFTIVMVAMVVHFALSIIYGLTVGLVIHGIQRGMALLIGAGFGLALYLVNFYVFTAVFPWFATARNWVSIFAHIVFGLVTAWAYKKFQATAPAAPVETGTVG